MSGLHYQDYLIKFVQLCVSKCSMLKTAEGVTNKDRQYYRLENEHGNLPQLYIRKKFDVHSLPLIYLNE